jgi:hypothetical protein
MLTFRSASPNFASARGHISIGGENEHMMLVGTNRDALLACWFIFSKVDATSVLPASNHTRFVQVALARRTLPLRVRSPPQ